MNIQYKQKTATKPVGLLLSPACHNHKNNTTSRSELLLTHRQSFRPIDEHQRWRPINITKGIRQEVRNRHIDWCIVPLSRVHVGVLTLCVNQLL